MDDRSLRLMIGTLAVSGLLLAGCEQSVPPPIDTSRLVAVETPPPAYPPELACANVGGRVLLRLTIETDGRPVQVETLESSGQPALDAAAREAVQTWRFEPPMRAGVAARSHVNVPVTFTPPVEKPEICGVLEDQQRSPAP